MATSTVRGQSYTHTSAQCSPASVGLAQARPNNCTQVGMGISMYYPNGPTQLV